MKTLGFTILFALFVTLSGGVARAQSATDFSANGASCIPTGDFAVNISAGALTAGGGATVTCYVPVSKHDVGFTTGTYYLELTHKGTGGTGGSISASIVKMAKSSGAETTLDSITGTASSTVRSDYSLGFGASSFDFNNYFLYIRVTITSPITAGTLRTLYGVALLH